MHSVPPAHPHDITLGRRTQINGEILIALACQWLQEVLARPRKGYCWPRSESGIHRRQMISKYRCQSSHLLSGVNEFKQLNYSTATRNKICFDFYFLCFVIRQLQKCRGKGPNMNLASVFPFMDSNWGIATFTVIFQCTLRAS